MNHYYKIKYKKVVTGFIEVTANTPEQARKIADSRYSFIIWDSTAQITRGKNKIADVDYEN